MSKKNEKPEVIDSDGVIHDAVKIYYFDNMTYICMSFQQLPMREIKVEQTYLTLDQIMKSNKRIPLVDDPQEGDKGNPPAAPGGVPDTTTTTTTTTTPPAPPPPGGGGASGGNK